MTFITHGFRVSVVSDVQERVQDLGSPLYFMLRRSSLVECVSVLHGTCLQCKLTKWFMTGRFLNYLFAYLFLICIIGQNQQKLKVHMKTHNIIC
jgi:hypothetical protein